MASTQAHTHTHARTNMHTCLLSGVLVWRRRRHDGLPDGPARWDVNGHGWQDWQWGARGVGLPACQQRV